RLKALGQKLQLPVEPLWVDLQVPRIPAVPNAVVHEDRAAGETFLRPHRRKFAARRRLTSSSARDTTSSSVSIVSFRYCMNFAIPPACSTDLLLNAFSSLS